MESFHDVLFPLGVSFGATGGPQRRNEIITLVSGHEKRNARFAGARRYYDAGTGLRSLDDLHTVMEFFEARRGSLHGFRFRDPFDMKSCRPEEEPGVMDQAIGTGDGSQTHFQLVKTYGDGPDPVVRTITRPVTQTVLVAVNGSEQQEGTDFSVDTATGKLEFQPGSIPGGGAVITAGFVFDVPVRFDTDRLEISLRAFRAGQIPTIPLVELL